MMNWLVQKYLKYCKFILTNTTYKIFFLFIWVAIPIIDGILKGISVNEYFQDVFSYEITWYVMFVFVIVAQTILYKLTCSKFKIGLTYLSKKWLSGFFLLYVFASICCCADMLNGLLFSTKYNLSFIYGNIYGIYLFLIRVLLFAPALINFFLVLINFYFYHKTTFKNINTPQKLIEAKELALSFKRANRLLYIGYFFFVTLTFAAYIMKDYVGLSLISNGLPNDIDISFALHIGYVLVPVFIALIYRASIITSFSKIIFDCYLALKPTGIEQKKIELIYFDKTSPYCVSSHIIYYLINTMIPVVVASIVQIYTSS